MIGQRSVPEGCTEGQTHKKRGDAPKPKQGHYPSRHVESSLQCKKHALCQLAHHTAVLTDDREVAVSRGKK